MVMDYNSPILLSPKRFIVLLFPEQKSGAFSFPIIYVRMPELVREKCAIPNKFGLPDTINIHISKLIS